MNGTLPLFQELEAPCGGRPSGGDPPAPDRAAPSQAVPPRPSPAAAAREKHLRAAWRLSRAMKRMPHHSAEQTRAGLAICRHLQALLAETDQQH